jgi:FkbM family methyltransferase
MLQLVFPKGIPDIRWRGFKFLAPPKHVNKTITASIFWGFYESAEIRYIEQYLDGELDVIEFGSSIGIVTSHIVSKLKSGRKLVAVEANPFLVDTIRQNAGRYVATGAKYEIINKAIGYESATVTLAITDNNTETRTMNPMTGDGITIATSRLRDIIQESAIENYVLVCDIEGAEVQVLEQDKACLQYCRQLFIELHDTTYQGKTYNVDSIISLLTVEHGFRLLDRHGPVCVFTR